MKKLVSRGAAATVAVAAIAFITGAASAATLPDPVAYTSSGFTWDSPQPATIQLGDGTTQLRASRWVTWDGQGATGHALLCIRKRHHHRWRCRAVRVRLSGPRWHATPDGQEQYFSGLSTSGGGQQQAQQFTYRNGWQPRR